MVMRVVVDTFLHSNRKFETDIPEPDDDGNYGAVYLVEMLIQ